MTLNEHYKFHSRKSLKSYTKLFIFIVLFIVVLNTFARYENAYESNPLTQIAKWNIKINNHEVTASTGTITSNVNIIPDTIGEENLGAGDTGYFDIEINPELTEVSIEYTITLDISHLPSNTIITGCELYNKNGSKVKDISLLTDENVKKYLKDEILLNENRNTLGENDIKKYRMHCKIDEDVVIEQDEVNNFYVTMEISGRQVI